MRGALTVVKAGWRSAATAAMFAAAGVVFGALAAEVSQRLVREREQSCDGSLTMPVSGFWYGWLGVVVAGLGLAVSVLRLIRGRRSTLDIMLVAILSLVLCFVVFLLLIVYQEAPTRHSPCFG